MALHGGGKLALALGGRFLVVLARAQLGEKAGLLHRALEPAHRDFERLVFLDSNGRHPGLGLVGGLECIKIIVMLVLGIETSCGGTGVALYDAQARRLLAHAVQSQVEKHEAYGGVVPELASRDHSRRLVPLTRAVVRDAGKSLQDIGAIGYTAGPGLAGALLVGASFARGLGE